MDRKVVLKIIRRIKRQNINPDELIESFGAEIPYIGQEPKLSDYELPGNALDILLQEDVEFKKKNKIIAKYTIACSAIIGFYWGWGSGIVEAIIMSLLGLYPIGAVIYMLITEREPRKTVFRGKVKQYETAKFNYEYWQRKKKREYWKGLSGHGFEDALAQLFRKIGYRATVSKSGGDEGIDIILEKDNEKTIVQCKAHSKPIGPVVARELYGAMIHFNAKKGILASTCGFTDGVRNFVVGKQIELLNLEDILKIAESIRH